MLHVNVTKYLAQNYMKKTNRAIGSKIPKYDTIFHLRKHTPVYLLMQVTNLVLILTHRDIIYCYKISHNFQSDTSVRNRDGHK